jgi:hypothetical protein
MSVLNRDGEKRLHTSFLQVLVGAGFDASQEGFEFGKGLLYSGAQKA